MRREAHKERGAIAVEFALLIPIVLLIILWGVHLGRALGAKHSLQEATNYVTRVASIKSITNAAQIRTMVLARLGGRQNECSWITITAQVINGPASTQQLVVKTTCTLTPPLGMSLGVLAHPDQVSSEAAYPLPL